MLELRRLAGHDVRDLSEEGLERLSDSHITERDSIRLSNQTPGSVTPRLLQVLTECRDALTSGAIVTVEEARYRLRRLPIEPSTR